MTKEQLLIAVRRGMRKEKPMIGSKRSTPNKFRQILEVLVQYETKLPKHAFTFTLRYHSLQGQKQNSYMNQLSNCKNSKSLTTMLCLAMLIQTGLRVKSPGQKRIK